MSNYPDSVQMPQVGQYCRACGQPLVASAAVCPRCGTPTKALATVGAKERTVAVLLAIFLGPWTWLYTYKANAWKFWLGVSLWFLGWITSWLLVGLLPALGIWIWAIVDTAAASDEFYDHYGELYG